MNHEKVWGEWYKEQGNPRFEELARLNVLEIELRQIQLEMKQAREEEMARFPLTMWYYYRSGPKIKA